MAVIDKKFKLRGTVGPVTYRVYKSKTIVQSRPKRHTTKQTQATKTCSSEFAVASNTARVIRVVFIPVFRRLNDGGMVNRFTAAVLAAMQGNRQKERGVRELYGGDLSHLESFQFNILSPLHAYLLVRPRVELSDDRRLTVKLPAFDVAKELKKPEWSTKSAIRIVVVAFNFRRKQYQDCGMYNIEITSGQSYQEAIEWVCPEHIPAGCITLVTMSLNYYQKEITGDLVTCNTNKIMPAGIIAAFETEAEEIDNWDKIPKSVRMSLDMYLGGERVEKQLKVEN